MASGVYCIENVTNGRRYIGSADIQKRWKEVNTVVDSHGYWWVS